MTDLDLLLDGRWQNASTGDRIFVVNPARPGETVGSIPAGAAADVDAAVASARRAQAAWRDLPLKQRAEALSDAATRLADIDPSAPQLLTREMGKVLAESTLDFQSPPWVWSHYLGDLDAVEQLLTEEHDDASGRLVIRRRPVGVVGAIVPWNWPIALLGVKLGPALLAGNAVIAVPSPYASLAVLTAVRALAEALPPGLVNVVTGYGEVVGAALAAHPYVDMVAFTGGHEAGRAVARSLGDRVRRGVFELGGNDAAIVLEDAVVDDSLIEQIAGSFAMTSGQVCFAIKRLYVHESVRAAVTDGLAARLEQYVVGDGLDPQVTMGPLANSRQDQRFTAILDDARRCGASVNSFGRLADSHDAAGYFHLPALVTGIGQQARIVQEEQFGPALPVIGFNTDDEAITLANGTPFGLTSSVWTADSSRGWALADRIDAGVTFVNAHGMAAFDVRAPFGGVKGSGYGREMGNDGLLEFTVAHQAREPRPM